MTKYETLTFVSIPETNQAVLAGYYMDGSREAQGEAEEGSRGAKRLFSLGGQTTSSSQKEAAKTKFEHRQIPDPSIRMVFYINSG